jgi:hypothetical protein
VPVQAPHLAVAFLLATSSGDGPSAASPGVRPAQWVGARLEGRIVGVSVAQTGSLPRPVGRPSTASSVEVTDVAYDTRRGIIYVGTCCEPGSGHLLRLDARSSATGLEQDDQGFAVDVAGPRSTIARTDTFGTLAVRAAPDQAQEVRADAGVADVAVDGSGSTRVIALVDARRLRAIVPVVSEHDPGLLIRQRTAEGPGWTDTMHSLPREASYCRVVPLADGAVGLLAGAPVRGRAWECHGERLDVYDTALRRLRTGVLAFPGRVRHLSIDDSSTFLIFTTVEGAVGWRTLDGRGGDLAARGFMAADW